MLFLFSLHGGIGWGVTLQMWLIWKERNAQTFEETEKLVDRVKSLLLRTLFEWSRMWGFTHCHSLFEFLNSVSLSF